MAAPRVRIQTTLGTFTVELYDKHAPRTVENFLRLSNSGYYDGTKVRIARPQQSEFRGGGGEGTRVPVRRISLFFLLAWLPRAMLGDDVSRVLVLGAKSAASRFSAPRGELFPFFPLLFAFCL